MFINDHPFSIEYRTSEKALSLVLEFLSVMDIKYYWEPENFNERNKFDDVSSWCRDIVGRAVLSLVADKVKHEGDGATHDSIFSQQETSKYAISLLSDLGKFMCQSKKTGKQYIILATCNPSGVKGKGLERDQVNEHKVKMVK